MSEDNKLPTGQPRIDHLELRKVTKRFPGVLANDSDVDGDSLSAVWVSGPNSGTLTLNSDGSFT